MPDVQISTSVPEDVGAELQRLADTNLITKAAIVRQILAAAVRRESEKKTEEVPA
jgi:predicted transcriptional regulator